MFSQGIPVIPKKNVKLAPHFCILWILINITDESSDLDRNV